MKFNVEQINVIAKALNEVAEKPMKISLAFKLNKLLTQISTVLADAEKVRMKLITSFGKPVIGKMGVTEIPDENIEIFNKELKELLEQEVNVDFEPFELSELGDIQLTLNQVKGLNLITKGN